jgi:allantoin racemase
MKIWYQSFASFKRLPNYARAIEEYLGKIGNERVSFEVHGLDSGGVGDEYRVFEYFDTNQIIKNSLIAGRSGFQAYAIANILDPGLYESRQISKIPVLGLCESSLLVASLMGKKISLITVNENFIPRIEENVRRYGLWDRLKGIGTMKIEVEYLDLAYKDETIRNKIINKFMEEARPLIREGAEVIIPAGGVAMLLLALSGVHKVDGIPIVNGIIALTNVAEMMVRFQDITGVFISRRMTYVSPEEKRWREALTVYGLE